MLHRDSIAGAVVLIFCAVVYWLTTGFNEPPAMLSQNVPPTFFPRAVLAAMGLLGLLLLISGWRKAPVAAGRLRPVVFATAAMILAAGVLAGLIGMLLTISALAVALPIRWGERRWHLIGLLAVCLPTAMYLIFTLALDVRFPVGRLFEL
jgi:hypothetical protein